MTTIRGQGASPGRARGPLAVSAAEAIELAERGTPAIFARSEMDADDVPGIRAAAGVIIARGGITADGAVAARALGKPCIVGCSSFASVAPGTIVSIDGATGQIEVEG